MAFHTGYGSRNKRIGAGQQKVLLASMIRRWKQDVNNLNRSFGYPHPYDKTDFADIHHALGKAIADAECFLVQISKD